MRPLAGLAALALLGGTRAAFAGTPYRARLEALEARLPSEDGVGKDP